MRRSFAIVATLVALALAAPAAAQSERARAPATGMVGMGMSISAAIPNDDALKNGLRLGLSAEGYLTPRISVRGAISGAWLDIVGRPFTGTIQPITALGSVVYNWEGGAVHPFVAGGAGWYHYRFTENSLHSSADKIGLNMGGGAEWFFTRRDTFTGEVTYHVLPDRINSRLSSYEPTFWTVAFGYKKYF